jgi:hypothetical protein
MSERRPGRVLRLLLGFYFLEAGLFLILAPWSRFWTERVALPAPASLAPLLASPAFRGFVAGLGILHLGAAARDLLGRKEEEP